MPEPPAGARYVLPAHRDCHFVARSLIDRQHALAHERPCRRDEVRAPSIALRLTARHQATSASLIGWPYRRSHASTSSSLQRPSATAYPSSTTASSGATISQPFTRAKVKAMCSPARLLPSA